MTMTKFEPVGYYFRDDPKYFAMPGAGYSHEYPTNALDVVPLYTADQLTEAYEAGKRDAIPEWQPIDTAPKDGTAFRAYADELIDLDFNPCGSVEAAWNGEELIGCVWNGQQDAWYGKAINPTHWMPLPAAPKGLK